VIDSNTETEEKKATRRRHWIVLSGEGSAEYRNACGYRYGFIIEPNEHVEIPSGATYRIMNRTECPIVIIEVQLSDDQTIDE